MRYQTIDLFSGAGGLSYGFEQASIEVTLAIEKDAWAVDTYKANHLPSEPPRHQWRQGIPDDNSILLFQLHPSNAAPQSDNTRSGKNPIVP